MTETDFNNPVTVFALKHATPIVILFNFKLRVTNNDAIFVCVKNEVNSQ